VNVLTENGFDRYFGKVMPLAVAISLMKTFLAEELTKQIIEHIQTSEHRSLTKEEEKIIARATDAAVATLNPDIFEIDANWSPKSVDEMKEKMVDLKLDPNFRQGIVDAVLRTLARRQAKLNDES
jgi:predicted metal-dependent peptidase